MAWTNLSFAYGSVLTSAKMTQMYDNMTTISPLFASGLYGTLLAFTKITATNATWSPNAATKKIVTCVVGGGGAGGGATGAPSAGFAGKAGAMEFAVSTSISGTYAATIGAGGIGVSNGDGNSGSASSFIGTGLSVSAAGGAGGKANYLASYGLSGDSCVGIGGAAGNNSNGGAAAANSGAGGGSAHDVATTYRTGGGGGSGVIYVWEWS